MSRDRLRIVEPPHIPRLLELPPPADRELRMEALIARIRLFVVLTNIITLRFFLDTRGWHVDAAWAVILFALAYAVPVAALQPYKRWRVFRTSVVTAAFDSIAIAAFVACTGASSSPYFLLYYLSVAAVAMRFDLRQAMLSCVIYGATYAFVYFATWEGSTDEFGQLAMRLAYMFFIAVGVGHLAREENSRSLQVEVIEQLNAENARLASRNERAARVDRLTGLLNRGYFEKLVQRELRRARSADHYVSVLFCDMDRLKRINDELGHDFGDRILKRAASALKGRLRPHEFIGRYGGDEFVVVLPNLTRETAYERGEQLIDAIAGVNNGLPEDLQVGLSVGVATCPFDATDYALLVKLADQAMYLAKRGGGNRVRTANDLRLFWEEMPAAA